MDMAQNGSGIARGNDRQALTDADVDGLKLGDEL